MAITFFGVATTPADNSGSSPGPTVTLTPPASMVDGDLVYVSVRYRDSAATISATPSNAGGQSWNAVSQYNTTNIRARVFWCRFNGTWSANPAFTVTSGTNNIDAQMLVFRPTSAAYTWTLESGPNSATYSAPSTPFTVTVTGRTTTAASTVSIAAWHSVDDNTWGTLSGTGWSKTSLGAQYRNNDTNDNSSTFAYNIQTTAGATNNVSQNQATLGGDAGSTSLHTFAETLVTAAVTGNAGTAAAGTLAISNTAEGLLGVVATAAAGTATVPGSGATNATGSPAGVAGTASAGALTVSLAPVAEPVGAGVAATAGSPVASTTVSIAGVSAAASAGTPAGIGASAGVVPIGGVAATASAGSLAKVITVAGIAGVQAAASVGAMAGLGAGIVNASGQPPGRFATAIAGELAISTTRPIDGVAAAVTAESLGASAVVEEIDGQSATSAAGATSQHMGAAIPWVAATALAGSPGPIGNTVASPTGVQAVATPGNAAGLTAGQAAGVPGGVAGAAAAGTLSAAWTRVAGVSGVAGVASAADVTVQGGDSSSTETFPSGVQAMAQVGIMTAGGAIASPFGVSAAASAGIATAAGLGAEPLFVQSITVVQEFDGMISVEQDLTIATLFAEPVP